MSCNTFANIYDAILSNTLLTAVLLDAIYCTSTVRLLTLLEWITYTISTSSNRQFSMKGIYSQRRELLSFVGKVHCSKSWGIFSFRHKYWMPNFLKRYFLFNFASEYNKNRYTNRMKLGLQQIFKKKWN